MPKTNNNLIPVFIDFNYLFTGLAFALFSQALKTFISSLESWSERNNISTVVINLFSFQVSTLTTEQPILSLNDLLKFTNAGTSL